MANRSASGTWDPGFSTTVDYDRRDLKVVSISGELDAVEARGLVEFLCSLAGRTIIVDLSRLSFIDASGIRALVDSKTFIEARGDAFMLRNVFGFTRTLFQIVGLDELLDSSGPIS